jgi:hypothetical protein
VKALPNGRGEAGDSSMAQHVTGQFRGSVWGIACVLELHLDDAGRLRGSFDADGEPLEVTGDTPDPFGAVRGVIRARALEESFAVFQARANADRLLLEVRMTDADERALERVTFSRVSEPPESI